MPTNIEKKMGDLSIGMWGTDGKQGGFWG